MYSSYGLNVSVFQETQPGILWHTGKQAEKKMQLTSQKFSQQQKHHKPIFFS